MNIFNYINTESILLRPFIYPKDKSPLSEFILFETEKGVYADTEPIFVQYEPFKHGYTFSFNFRINEKVDLIKEIVDNNKLLEVLVKTNFDENSYYRIGDKNGFKIIDFKNRYSICPDEYIIKLQSIKPNFCAYEKIYYQNNNNITINKKYTNETVKKKPRKRVFEIKKEQSF